MAGRWNVGCVPLLRQGNALALLPWLHTRFAILATALDGHAAVRTISAKPFARRLAPSGNQRRCVAVVLLCDLRHAESCGGLRWRHTNEPREPSARPRGDLFDQQFGLLPNAPVYACAACGFVLMMRRHRRLTIELLLVAGPYGLAVVLYQMWWAGASSPARFLVAILLPAAIPAAVWFSVVGHGARSSGLERCW